MACRLDSAMHTRPYHVPHRHESLNQDGGRDPLECGSIIRTTSPASPWSASRGAWAMFARLRHKRPMRPKNTCDILPGCDAITLANEFLNILKGGRNLRLLRLLAENIPRVEFHGLNSISVVSVARSLSNAAWNNRANASASSSGERASLPANDSAIRSNRYSRSQATPCAIRRARASASYRSRSWAIWRACSAVEADQRRDRAVPAFKAARSFQRTAGEAIKQHAAIASRPDADSQASGPDAPDIAPATCPCQRACRVAHWKSERPSFTCCHRCAAAGHNRTVRRAPIHSGE